MAINLDNRVSKMEQATTPPDPDRPAYHLADLTDCDQAEAARRLAEARKQAKADGALVLKVVYEDAKPEPTS